MNVRNDLLRRLRTLENQLRRVENAGELQNIARIVERKISAEGHMSKIVEKRFNKSAQYASGHPKWKKRKRHYPWPILIKSGRLKTGSMRVVRYSFRYFGRTRFLDKIRNMTMIYAVFHQFGTPKLPKRPFLNDPSVTELKPIRRRARRLFAKELDRRLKVR